MSTRTKDRPELPQLPEKSEFSEEPVEVPDIAEAVEAATEALDDGYRREPIPAAMHDYEKVGSDPEAVAWFVRAMRRAQEAGDHEAEYMLALVHTMAPAEFVRATRDRDVELWSKFREMPYASRTPCRACGSTLCVGSRIATLGS